MTDGLRVSKLDMDCVWLNLKERSYRVIQSPSSHSLKISRQKLTNRAWYHHKYTDETALLWKILPDKFFIAHTESDAPGRKICKDRISVLFCTNADGSNKITPLTIGKSKNHVRLKMSIYPSSTLIAKTLG